MKKLLAMALTFIMIIGLSACGTQGTATSGNTTSGSESESTGPVLENVIIGVVVSSPTNSEVVQLVEYLNYLSENMPVTFKISEATSSPEKEIFFIENCATAGVKAIIGQYASNPAAAIEKCAEYGMYYSGSAENPEIYDAYKDNPYYLGSITWGNGNYDALYQMGKYLTDLGCKKIVYANGGADSGVQQFIERQDGFKAAIAEAGLNYNESVIVVSGFPADPFYAAQQAALSEKIDAVCASFNGVDYWATPMAANGLAGKIPLASYGSLNQLYLDAMVNGTLNVLAATNVQKYGLQVGLIFNAVNGDAAALKDNGVSATNKATSVWLISDPQEAKKIFDIQEGQKIFSAEDVLSLCTKVNPNASSKTLEDLIANSSVEKILAR